MNVGGEDTSGRESGQGRRPDARTRRQRDRNMRKTDKLLRDCPALHAEFLTDVTRTLDAEAAELERRLAELVRRWRLSRLTLIDGGKRLSVRRRP